MERDCSKRYITLLMKLILKSNIMIIIIHAELRARARLLPVVGSKLLTTV